MQLYVGDLKNEVWRNVIGYEGLYMVSDMGRIMSLGRRGNNKKMILSGSPDSDGYIIVNLRKNNEQCKSKVHQLVMKAFVPNPKKLPEVNHKKGRKKDNRVSQLEWSTSSNNKKHAFLIGLMVAPRGGKSPVARKVGKILDGEVVKRYDCISAAKADGCTIYGVCKAIKKGCRHKGYYWKYLDEPNKKVA